MPRLFLRYYSTHSCAVTIKASLRLPPGGVPKAADVEPFRVVKENKCGALVSGRVTPWWLRQRLLRLPLDLLKNMASGVVGSNHTISSSGSIGYFSRQLAKQGLIGFCVRWQWRFSFCSPLAARLKLNWAPTPLLTPSPIVEVKSSLITLRQPLPTLV